MPKNHPRNSVAVLAFFISLQTSYSKLLNIFNPHYHEINTVSQCNQQTMIMQESKSDFQKKKILSLPQCVSSNTLSQTYLCDGKRQTLSHEQTL